jgi:hypothetical protein
MKRPARYCRQVRRHVPASCGQRAMLPPPLSGLPEFACHFGPVDGSEQPVAWIESLGLMLYDIRFAANGGHLPAFFHAVMRDGVLHCDTRSSGPNGEPPLKFWAGPRRRAHDSEKTLRISGT